MDLRIMSYNIHRAIGVDLDGLQDETTLSEAQRAALREDLA